MIPPSIRHAAAALAVAFLAAGCEDPFEQEAQRPNVDGIVEAWALSGTPASYPSALLLPQFETIRIEPSGTFDLAFDIDADGRLVVLPVNRVVTPIDGTRSIGLQLSLDDYSTIIEAPLGGWEPDSAMLVSPGTSFLVRIQTRLCLFDPRPHIYGKFYVESVDPVTRRIVMLGRVNPNCGYRSLLTGIPEY